MTNNPPSWIALSCLLISAVTVAQVAARLDTADTHLQFEAGPKAPRLTTLRGGVSSWTNRAAEVPIPTVEIAGQSVPLEWEFRPADSHTDKSLASFVYETTTAN